MRSSINTGPSLWGGALVLAPHYKAKHWYWHLIMRWNMDTDPSLRGGALILASHYEVEHCYWPLTMKWSIYTEPSLWGGALTLAPHYEVEHWHWPLTMRWSLGTDPSLWAGALVLTYLWCSMLSRVSLQTLRSNSEHLIHGKIRNLFAGYFSVHVTLKCRVFFCTCWVFCPC